MGKKKKGFFGDYKLTIHTKNCDLQSISDMMHMCIDFSCGNPCIRYSDCEHRLRHLFMRSYSC